VIFAQLIQSASNLPTDASALQSAISVLEREIRTLDSSSVPLERLQPWFTAVVALGVLMELGVIWREHRDGITSWRRGTIRSPDRPSTFHLVIGLVSVFLIAGGIVGELSIGIKITSLNGVLRTKNAELRSKTDQFVALLGQQTEQLRSDNLILANSLAELQARIQWRHIPPNKLPSLIRLLESGPKGAIRIDCVSSSEDACPFAREIAQALSSAHWPPLRENGNVTTSLGSDSSIGQGILVRDPSRVPSFAVHLYKAFHVTGMEFPGTPSPTMPEGLVILKIGRKPEAKLQSTPNRKSSK
jgi:hypothetical protein